MNIPALPALVFEICCMKLYSSMWVLLKSLILDWSLRLLLYQALYQVELAAPQVFQIFKLFKLFKLRVLTCRRKKILLFLYWF